MAYTKFMITCMLHFRESYPESCPRIIPANHTSETYLRISKGGRNIPRNIPPNHTSETYLESYPLMQHALLGTEFSEKAIWCLCVAWEYYIHDNSRTIWTKFDQVHLMTEIWESSYQTWVVQLKFLRIDENRRILKMQVTFMVWRHMTTLLHIWNLKHKCPHLVNIICSTDFSVLAMNQAKDAWPENILNSRLRASVARRDTNVRQPRERQGTRKTQRQPWERQLVETETLIDIKLLGIKSFFGDFSRWFCRSEDCNP